MVRYNCEYLNGNTEKVLTYSPVYFAQDKYRDGRF